MARTFTLGTLVTRCKQRCDMENQTLISTAEWKGMISSVYARLQAELVKAGLRYFETSHNLTTQSTALPAGFLSSVGVDYVVSASTGERRALYELMHQERNLYRGQSASESRAYALEGANIVLYPAPISGQTYVHTYVPQPTDLSGGADGDSVDVVTPDGEEFVIWGTAVLALAKEESDTAVARVERDEALARVMEWATLRSLSSSRRRLVADEAVDWDPADWR